jgi:hypothetical protein
MTIRFLNPVQEADVNPANMAPRLSSLEGVRLGFLSNSKQNADRLLECVAEELKSKYSLNGLVHENKFNAGTNCPTELMDELVSKVDAVITAIGD